VGRGPALVGHGRPAEHLGRAGGDRAPGQGGADAWDGRSPPDCAYRPLHHPGLSHAFINTLLFLDYDRSGLDHPVLPLAVNCYGSAVISRRGYIGTFAGGAEPDPPSPSPRRLLAVGAALAEIVRDRGERIALIASSSWSHAFLCDKTWRIRPDTDADRAIYHDMVDGDCPRARLRSSEWFTSG
jgi:hypothetical protein